MAIVGNGDIAKILPRRAKYLFFASGVSNSAETKQSEFAREAQLLLEQDYRRRLVYFSSFCVFYSDTPYAQHKRMMEGLVRSFPRWTIIRLGNITWGKNPRTLLNYLRHRIEHNLPYKTQNTYRYLCDKEELLYWLDLIPDWNCEMNIPGRRLKVKDIVKEIKYAIPKRTR